MKKKKRQRSRWPSGVPVFYRDFQDKHLSKIPYEAVGLFASGALMLRNVWESHDWADEVYCGGCYSLIPLNADARAMLAIAKAAR